MRTTKKQYKFLLTKESARITERGGGKPFLSQLKFVFAIGSPALEVNPNDAKSVFFKFDRGHVNFKDV